MDLQCDTQFKIENMTDGCRCIPYAELEFLGVLQYFSL